jgi:hypothetical protein
MHDQRADRSFANCVEALQAVHVAAREVILESFLRIEEVFVPLQSVVDRNPTVARHVKPHPSATGAISSCLVRRIKYCYGLYVTRQAGFMSHKIPLGALINMTEAVDQTAALHATLLKPSSLVSRAIGDDAVVSAAIGLTNESLSLEEKYFAISPWTELADGFALEAKSSRAAKNLQRVLSDDHDLRRSVLDRWDAIRESRASFRAKLAAIVDDKASAIETARRSIEEALLDQIVIVPKLSWNGKSLEREDHVFTRSLDGVIGYALMLLLDRDRDLAARLKRCKLSACGNFFLTQPASSGGRPPLYCSREHQAIHSRETGAERTQRWRKAKRLSNHARRRK